MNSMNFRIELDSYEIFGRIGEWKSNLKIQKDKQSNFGQFISHKYVTLDAPNYHVASSDMCRARALRKLERFRVSYGHSIESLFACKCSGWVLHLHPEYLIISLFACCSDQWTWYQLLTLNRVCG